MKCLKNNASQHPKISSYIYRKGPKIKYLITLLLLLTVVLPAYSQLTQDDLNSIRLIVKDEIKSEIEASEKRIKEYIDIKFEAVNEQFKTVDERFNSVDKQIQGFDKRVSDTKTLTYTLIAFIAVVIGLPQVIAFWRNRKDDQETKKQIETLSSNIETLTQRIEALENGRIQTS